MNKINYGIAAIMALVWTVGFAVGWALDRTKRVNEMHDFIFVANCQELANTSGLAMNQLAVDGKGCLKTYTKVTNDRTRWSWYIRFHDAFNPGAAKWADSLVIVTDSAMLPHVHTPSKVNVVGAMLGKDSQ